LLYDAVMYITKRSFGETRQDGFRFWGYEKRKRKDGSVRVSERWASPESFKSMCEISKRAASRSQKRNPERHAANKRAWEAKNIEVVRKQKREWFRKHYSKNSAKYVEYAAARRQRLQERSGNSRIERSTINSIYEASHRATKCTGIQFHVDHIKPLSRGGMHIPNNLQILPAKINLQKSDKEF
jgi:hypothetical protein